MTAINNYAHTPPMGVIFDLDGTLLDTVLDLGEALNTVFRNHGFPTHETSFYKNVIGNGLATFIQKSLPDYVKNDGKLQVYWQETRDAYELAWTNHTKLFEGMDQVLDYLKEHNSLIAIDTNKNQIDAEAMVRELLGKWRFDAVVGLHDGLIEKPNPQGLLEILAKFPLKKEEWMYIGDQQIDMETANRAGVTALWAAWGYEEPHGSYAQTNTILQTPRDLIELIGY